MGVKTEDESHFAIVREERAPYHATLERFDRIAFAMRALSILEPKHLRVAVYTRVRDLRVESAHDLHAAGASGRVALLGIPPDASRQSIALALADLTGAAATPFLVDLLVVAGAAPDS